MTAGANFCPFRPFHELRHVLCALLLLHCGLPVFFNSIRRLLQSKPPKPADWLNSFQLPL